MSQDLYDGHMQAEPPFDADGDPIDQQSEEGNREELARAISSRIRTAADGVYWCNDHPRWGEGLPPLATAYALAALKRCQGP
jgi:hypothetical protein